MKTNSNIHYGSFKKPKGFSKFVLIYDAALNKYKSEILRKLGKDTVIIPVRAVETAKDLKNVSQIYKKLNVAGVDKKSAIIALGGGVIGDLSGFVAATYLRGIPLIAVPTTILSQVDSSIGGKNGVNLSAGKNLVGTITQPKDIFIDHKYLQSLPEREIISGLGEILKYSILNNRIKFFKLSSKNLIAACAKYKVQIVNKDEFDEKGIRQALNFGHTFGHVLETLTAYKRYKHGEAVIWGIKFSCIVSYNRGIMKFEDFRDIMNLANHLDIPSLPKNLNAEKCYQLALKDKKSHSGEVKMVLVKKRGKVITRQSVSKVAFIEAVNMLKDFS